LDSVEHSMLRAFGSNYIIKYAAPNLSPQTARLLATQAVARGKPTITVEAGRAGTYTAEDIRSLMDGTLNVMGQLQMLNRAAPLLESPVYLERTLDINSEASGTFIPLTHHGEYVARGMRVGYVTDAYGRVIFNAIAPESGVVLYLIAVPTVVKGTSLVFLGIPAR
jgi:predicted deacylase